MSATARGEAAVVLVGVLSGLPDSPPVVASARRLEIRRRAPDRARLRIASSRVPAADPWLDDEHDWEL